MAKSKILTSIVALRKKYPKSKLGYREKNILNSSGAKITNARDYQDCYRVTKGKNSFIFTYKKQNYNDFTVVG